MATTETDAKGADAPQHRQLDEDRGFDHAPKEAKPAEAPAAVGTKSAGNTLSKAAAPNPIEHPQNLPTAIVGVKEKPDVKAPSLPIIGFNLSSFVLIIISCFIVFLMVFLFVKDFDASSSIHIPAGANVPDSTYARKIELVRMIQEEKRSFREFTVQVAQMILLNLLLPVLTAILGYIFGVNRNRE